MNRIEDQVKYRLPKSKEVLLVDDEKDLGWIMQGIIQEAGHRFTFASSVKEGIEKFKRTKRLDVVIVDLHLKNESGLVFVRKARAINRRVKLIMLSAFGTAEAKNKARRLGVEQFLDKPITPDRLLDIINYEPLVQKRI